jgi:formylglycine-generating enzyme
MRKRYNPNKLYKSICKEWNQTIEGWEEELRKKVRPLFALGKEDQVSGYQLVVSLGEGGLCEFIEPINDKFHLKRGVPFNVVPLILQDVAERNSVWHPLYNGGFFSELLYPMKLIPNADFYMGIYEVTQELYENVTGKNPSAFKGEGYESNPVEKVSWCDAVLFCNTLSTQEGLEPVYEIPKGLKAACKSQSSHYDRTVDELSKGVKWNQSANGYRLPTEAEWEYCARAGQDTIYSGSDNIGEVAWYESNTDYETVQVGQKKANGFGLYDMSGNVQEWVFNTWEGERSPRRVIRGGSWYDRAWSSRVSFRYRGRASLRDDDIGFRMARNA